VFHTLWKNQGLLPDYIPREKAWIAF
jgi:hypothetical protein